MGDKGLPESRIFAKRKVLRAIQGVKYVQPHGKRHCCIQQLFA